MALDLHIIHPPFFLVCFVRAPYMYLRKLVVSSPCPHAQSCTPPVRLASSLLTHSPIHPNRRWHTFPL